MLLLYVATSVVFGAPASWRVVLGAGAVFVDAAAIYGIWQALYYADRGDGILIAYRRR
jgi:hypothetical protein